MQRNLRQVFIRGALGTTLSIVAVAAAATQAAGFDGEIRIQNGRFVLVGGQALAAQCLEATRSEKAAAPGFVENVFVKIPTRG